MVNVTKLYAQKMIEWVHYEIYYAQPKISIEASRLVQVEKKTWLEQPIQPGSSSVKDLRLILG